MARIVLVADDSPAIQKRALVILKGEGFEVETVSNGVAAIKRLAVLHPAVILADVSMPGRDGYEVCEFVKQSLDLSNVPVLLFASDMEPYDDARGQEVRADGVIKKPFEARELISTVAKFADQSEGSMSSVTIPVAPSGALEPRQESAVVSEIPDSAPPPVQPPGLEALTPEPVFIDEQPAPAFQPPSPTREFSTMIFRAPVEIAEPVWNDEATATSPEYEHAQPAAVAPQVETERGSPQVPAGQPPEPMPSDSRVSTAIFDAVTLHEFAAGLVNSSAEVAESAPGEVPCSARPGGNPESEVAQVNATFHEASEPVGSSEVHPEAAADPPAFDWNLFYTVVHKTVIKMSPPPLPTEAVEEMARRIAYEIASEIISESSQPPA